MVHLFLKTEWHQNVINDWKQQSWDWIGGTHWKPKDRGKKKNYCVNRGLEGDPWTDWICLQIFRSYRIFWGFLFFFLKGNSSEDTAWKVNSFKILFLTTGFSWEEFVLAVILHGIVIMSVQNPFRRKTTFLDSVKNELLGCSEWGETANYMEIRLFHLKSCLVTQNTYQSRLWLQGVYCISITFGFDLI